MCPQRKISFSNSDEAAKTYQGSLNNQSNSLDPSLVSSPCLLEEKLLPRYLSDPARSRQFLKTGLPLRFSWWLSLVFSPDSLSLEKWTHFSCIKQPQHSRRLRLSASLRKLIFRLPWKHILHLQLPSLVSIYIFLILTRKLPVRLSRQN